MKCEGTLYLFKKLQKNVEAAGVRKKIKLRVESVNSNGNPEYLNACLFIDTFACKCFDDSRFSTCILYLPFNV